MYTYEIAVIGAEGGGPYDHAAFLEGAGYCLGPGAAGARLSLLHVEAWTVLSYHHGVYTSLTDSTKTVTTRGWCNIRGGGTDFVIPPNHRVVRVCAEAGVKGWAAGAPCLNFLQMEVDPVTEPGAPAISSIGKCSRTTEEQQLVGTHRTSRTEYCRVVDIPKGLTLAGIAGRGGDSWDQVRLLVCPWLPDGGAWSPAIHRHLVPPFKQQVRAFLLSLNELQRSGQIPALHQSDTANLVTALFQVTFLGEQPPGGAAADDCIASWVEQEVDRARRDGEQELGVHPGMHLEGLAVADFDSSDSGSPWEDYEEYEDSD